MNHGKSPLFQSYCLIFNHGGGFHFLLNELRQQDNDVITKIKKHTSGELAGVHHTPLNSQQESILLKSYIIFLGSLVLAVVNMVLSF